MLTTISLKLVFILCALVCFLLAFLNTPRYAWRDGGFFFLTLAIFA